MLSEFSKQEAIAESNRLRDLGYYSHAVDILKNLLVRGNSPDLEIIVILADTLACQGYWQDARDIHASFFMTSEDGRTNAGDWIYPAQMMYCLFETVCSGEQERSLEAAASVYNEYLQRGGLKQFAPDISTLVVTIYGTLLNIAHNFGISGKHEQIALNNLLENSIKPDFFELLRRRQHRNALRLATSYRLFSSPPDNLSLLQELRCHANAPEIFKALASFEIAKDLEQLGAYTQCDAIYMIEVSPVLERLGHSHAGSDIALSQKCRDNAYEGEGGAIWNLLLEYRVFDYPTGLLSSIKKALRRAEQCNDTTQQSSIWSLGRSLVSHAKWPLASWDLSNLYVTRLSQHLDSTSVCLEEGQNLYNKLLPTHLEVLKASVAATLASEFLRRGDGFNTVKWGKACETSTTRCTSLSDPDAGLLILQGRLLCSLQQGDLHSIIDYARSEIESDIASSQPERASAKCQALLSHIASQSPLPAAQSIIITQEFHGKNEGLKNQITASQPRPAAELWKAATELIADGKGRADLQSEEQALELLQRHHRIALHTGNIQLVADNERRSGILCCEMFEKSCTTSETEAAFGSAKGSISTSGRGSMSASSSSGSRSGSDSALGGSGISPQPRKWLIDRAFELMFSANSTYVRHADLENNKECAFWLAKISYEKSLHGWSGESEVLDRCTIAEGIFQKRRSEVRRRGGKDTIEARGMLVEIYRFAILTSERSGDMVEVGVWRDRYQKAVEEPLE